MDLLWRLESIYLGKELTKLYEYNTIYDPNELQNKYYIASLSRYPINLRDIYKPYELNLESYLNLCKYINVSKVTTDIEVNLSTQRKQSTISKLIYYCTGLNLFIYTPSHISDLIYDGALTPLGLLSLAIRRNYNNSEYKEYIESELLDPIFYNIGEGIYLLNKDNCNKLNLDYFDLATTADSYFTYPKEFLDDLLLNNPFIFKWRD